MDFKQSDTSKVVLFYMLDETDGKTEETGLTVSVSISKNGGAFAAATGTVAEVANGLYKLTPSSADVGTLGPIVFRATATGAASNMVLGRVVSHDPYDAVRMGLTALPDANADAAGGLPISDAGELDIDTKLANTNEITAARMGALTDLIDGGRLDLLIDAIKVCTDKLTDARMGVLTDLVDDGRLDLLIDAIKAKTDNLPASPAAVGSAMTLSDGAISAAKIAANALDGKGDWNTVAPSNTSIASILATVNHVTFGNEALFTAVYGVDEDVTSVLGNQTNITNAITALNDLSEGDIRTALGMADSNMDTVLGNILGDTNELQSLISDSKLPAQVKGTDNIDFSALQKTSLDNATPSIGVSGTIDANIVEILGTAITETDTGYLSAGVVKFFDVATPSKDMNDVGSEVTVEEDGFIADITTILNTTNSLNIKFTNMIEADGDDYRFTENALEESPTGVSIGGVTCTILIRDTDLTPLSNVKVWLNSSNDRTDSLVVPQVTALDGTVSFDITTGTYYVFGYKAGYEFSTSNNDITVTVDTTSFTLNLGSELTLPDAEDTSYDRSFITRSIESFRASVDEPSLNAKYTDDTIIDMLGVAYCQLLSEASRLHSAPIVIPYDITLSSGTNKYLLPINRNSIYAIYNESTTGYKIYYMDDGRYNIEGRGVWVEGNTLNVDDSVISAVTSLTIEYVPRGICQFVEGAVNSVDSTGKEITLSSTVNQGALSRNPSDYVGAIFRILADSDDNYNIIQERIITGYNPLTKKLTLNLALNPNAGDGVHSGTTYYEIVPVIGNVFDDIIPTHVAWMVANREGMSKRAKGIHTSYITALRNLKLDSFYSNLDSARNMDRSTYDRARKRRRF